MQSNERDWQNGDHLSIQSFNDEDYLVSFCIVISEMDVTYDMSLYELKLKWLNRRHGQIPPSDCVSNIGCGTGWKHSPTDRRL